MTADKIIFVIKLLWLIDNNIKNPLFKNIKKNCYIIQRCKFNFYFFINI